MIRFNVLLPYFVPGVKSISLHTAKRKPGISSQKLPTEKKPSTPYASLLQFYSKM